MMKIIDYGMGNCGSIKNMLRFLGAKAEIVSDPKGLENAQAIILPGVGSFDYGIERLEPFRAILEEQVVTGKVPFLGVCLGMQILLDKSAEGKLPGLGWISGEAKRFDFSKTNVGRPLVVPHMGWNEVKAESSDNLISRLDEDESARFYFVHSYHASHVPNENIMATCNYGYEFICAVRKDNIYGVQFHPEKSHKFGKQLFLNFIEIAKC